VGSGSPAGCPYEGSTFASAAEEMGKLCRVIMSSSTLSRQAHATIDQRSWARQMGRLHHQCRHAYGLLTDEDYDKVRIAHPHSQSILLTPDIPLCSTIASAFQASPSFANHSSHGQRQLFGTTWSQDSKPKQSVIDWEIPSVIITMYINSVVTAPFNLWSPLCCNACYLPSTR
jgi:hypothetical protein